MTDHSGWRQRMRRTNRDEREAHCLGVLALAHATEPLGYSGPGQTELALDEMDRIQAEYDGGEQ